MALVPKNVYDLPAEDFPFRIEFTRVDTGELVHTIVVNGPGAILVPPLSRQLGGVEIDARIVREDSHETTDEGR